jgi:hypothetical protein
MHPPARLVAVLSLFLGLGAGLLRARATDPVDTSIKGLVKSAAAYVADYEEKLKFVVATEEYVQRTFDEAGRQTRERVMNGELFLQYVEADHEWMAVHDFVAVDGDPVTDRQDVRGLLQRGSFESVVREVAARNARFNIGDVQRNFNEPTLALLIFGASRIKSFSFDRKTLQKTDADSVATLAFEEHDNGTTMIRNRRGSPAPSKGEVEIDAATGRILHTQLDVKIDGVVAQLSTTYANDKAVELWVPTTFTERYEHKTSTDYERIECKSTYTNFKRYGATGRIIRKG